LEHFFEQWFFSKGYPKLKAATAYDQAKNRISITVEQTQKDEKAGVGIFDIEMEVCVELEKSNWFIGVLSPCNANNGKDCLYIDSPSPPLQVIFDPEGNLLHTLDYSPSKESMLKRTLTTARTAKARWTAAKQLGRKATRSAVKTLVAAFSLEPLWYVRGIIAAAIGDTHRLDASKELWTLLKSEQDPKVVTEILRAIKAIKNPADPAKIRAWLDKENDNAPYSVLGRVAALECFGADPVEDDSVREDNLKFILEYMDALETRDSWVWVTRAALNAAGATRTLAAFEFLRGYIFREDTAPVLKRAGLAGLISARSAAISALASLAELVHAENRQVIPSIVAELTCMVRDTADSYGVRRAAAESLTLWAKVADPESLSRIHSTLADFQNRCRDNDGPAARKMCARAKANAAKKGDGGRFEIRAAKDIEALRADIRELKEELGNMKKSDAAEGTGGDAAGAAVPVPLAAGEPGKKVVALGMAAAGFLLGVAVAWGAMRKNGAPSRG